MVDYCNATWAGLTGHQAILLVHVGYVLAAAGGFLTIHNRQRETNEASAPFLRGSRLLPLAALLYAVDSFLWHQTAREEFYIGDGALSVFFLLALAEWARKPRPALRLAVLPAAAALLYVPLRIAFGEAAYFAAMAACGVPFLVLIARTAYRRRAHWFFAALAAISVALVAVRSDAAWCGETGFVTGHMLAHLFDSVCFFFLLQGVLRRPAEADTAGGVETTGPGFTRAAANRRAPYAARRQSRP